MGDPNLGDPRRTMKWDFVNRLLVTMGQMG
jgi:hypothetical protein